MLENIDWTGAASLFGFGALSGFALGAILGFVATGTNALLALFDQL